jgi:hypothetical protein
VFTIKVGIRTLNILIFSFYWSHGFLGFLSKSRCSDTIKYKVLKTLAHPAISPLHNSLQTITI